MPWLIALAAAGLGAAVGGVPGFFIGGLLGYVVARELNIRERLQELQEAQRKLAQLQSWAANMKAWADEAYTRLSEAAAPATDSDSGDTSPAETSDTEPPGLDTGIEPRATAADGPVPEPVASGPPDAARIDIATPGTPSPPDPSTRAPSPDTPQPAGAAPPDEEPAGTPEPGEPRPGDAETGDAETGDEPARTPELVPYAVGAQAPPDVAAAARERPPARPNPIRRLVTAAKNWITTGNAPVKVGVLVSLIGVGLLLREASRRGVINIPLEMRLIAVALFGLVLLGIGWRLRHKNPVYGLSLQGGSVAVLYLTTYASFAVYEVLPAALAAVAVLAVTVGAGLLAVTQDSPPLAVLGIIGGYLAPVLTYNRPEDHVAVFGFYAVLSAAIVAVAWYKTWPLLNLLGLGFTFAIAAFWLWRRFDADDWASVQPLIGMLILLYLAIPVLFAIREAPDLTRPSTAPLVFATPFLGFGLQYLAVGHTSYGMAISAAALALIHGLLALVAHRLGPQCRTLAEANVGLGVAFAVIAVPLAFDAHLTAVVWAAQGGLLAWIGCRRARWPAVAAGGALQVMAGIALVGTLPLYLPYPTDALPLANQFLPAAAVLALAGLLTGRMVHVVGGQARVEPSVTWLALGWGTGWWIAGGLVEIQYQMSAHRLAVSLGFVVASFAAASMLAGRLRWPHLHALGAAIGPTLWGAAALSLVTQELHPLDRFGWAVWPASLAVFYWFLRSAERRFLTPDSLTLGGDRYRQFAHNDLITTPAGDGEGHAPTPADHPNPTPADHPNPTPENHQNPTPAGDPAPTPDEGRALTPSEGQAPTPDEGQAWLRGLAEILHGGAFWVVIVLATAEAYWQTDNAADDIWLIVVPAAVGTAVAAAALLGARWLRWPLRAHRKIYVWACAGPALLALGVVAGATGLVSDGDPDPLPFVPLLNPLMLLLAALATLGAVWAAAARTLRGGPDRAEGSSNWLPAAAGAGVALATVELARTVHHYAGVEWHLEALINSTAFGVSLSILWGLIALAAMVAGARSGRRRVWVAGSGWMAVVLVKLVALDINVLTAPGRAASFIATGAILLLAAYLAPSSPAAPSRPDTPGTPGVLAAPPGLDTPAAADGPAAPSGPGAPADVETDWVQRQIARWLAHGNWPAPVGVLVSLVGAGLVLTQAAGHDLLASSIETRLGAVAAAGVVLLALGWLQRKARPVFGLSLQGGGIAMLHVAVYAGYPVHAVIGAAPAGAAVVGVTAAGVALSVVQDSRILAVLATVGGFAAPVLTYTEGGDHILVFGFYAILGAAIVAVAWFKLWPELNLLGLAATFAIAAWWIWDRLDPDDWASAQPLIAVLVLLYMSIPAISARRRGVQRMHEMWMHPLVFGTPFLALGVQQLLVGHLEYALAISAATLAVQLAALVMVVRGAGADSRELTATYAGLSTAFIAIAVPLALDGAYGATVWAVQGALLVWIGCRRGRILAVAGGGGLQVVAGAWFAVRLAESLPYSADVAAVVNEYLLASATLAVSGLVSGWRIQRASGRLAVGAAFMWLALAWGAGWWLTGGLSEIGSQIPDFWLAASLGFVVVSAGAAMAAAGPLRWPHLAALGLLIPPALVAALILSLAILDHPLDRYGWAAWPLSIAVFYACLRSGDQALATLADRLHAHFARASSPSEAAGRSASEPAPQTVEAASSGPVSDALGATDDETVPHTAATAVSKPASEAGSKTSGRPVALAAWLHGVGFWLVTVIVTAEIAWQASEAADGVWPLAVTLAAAMVVAGVPLGSRRVLRWPVQAYWRTYLLACSGPLLMMLAVASFGAAALSDGDASPLLHLPVLNPLGVLIAMQVALSLAWRSLAGAERDHPFGALVDARWAPTLAAAAVVLATAETARTVHQWLDVAWDAEALWESNALQTSLSILWTLVAISAMVAGVRLVRRVVWVAGASWMAVVLAKLFVVDLRNLSALGRVVSFIVVGVLLLIVGYLAPVPPVASDEPSAADEEAP